VSIVFDNCFMVGEIRVMQGPTGLFVSFPAKKQRETGPIGKLLFRPLLKRE
jgi:DNA-binding cell septation regulator SpoVG